MNKLTKQQKFCQDTGNPMFAPLNGSCYSCGKQVEDKDNELITGCDKCKSTYCD